MKVFVNRDLTNLENNDLHVLKLLNNVQSEPKLNSSGF